MTAPGGGGDRLEVPVVVDATGAARGLQKDIDERVKNIRATIKAEIDSKRLAAQAAAAAKRTEQQTKVQLKVGVDGRYLKESIRAALGAITSGEYRIKVGVDVDDSAAKAASKGGSATIDVDADTAGATAQVEGFRRSQESRPVKLPVKVDAKPLAGLANVAKTIGGPVKLLGPLFGAAKVGMMGLAAVGVPGLLSIAAAASQAGGAIAALPSFAGIAAQGIGALVAGFSGVGDAVGAMEKKQAGAGASAAASAKAQAAAAQRIAAAERGVTGAQQAALRAQQNLTDARKAAQERLEDYRLSLEGAALDEEGATLAVERARERWNQTMRDPVSTTLDRKEADLALREAEHRLASIKESNDDLAQEVSAAQTAGVEGSAEVVSAQEGIEQSTQSLADAQRELADAIADAHEAAVDGAGGVDLLAEAMSKLSPEGQKFARFVNDVLKPRMQQLKFAIQDAILPGIQRGVTAAMPFLDTLQAGMVDTGTRIGDLAEKAGKLFGSDVFRADVATIMASNNRAMSDFGDAGISMVSVLKDIAVAAGPMVETFANWVKELTDGWAAATGTAEGGKKLSDFFTTVTDRVTQLWHIIRDLTAGLFGFFSVGTEQGEGLLAKIEGIAAAFREWVNSEDGQAKIKKFWESFAPLLEKVGEIVSNVAETFVNLGKGAGGGGTIEKLLDTLVKFTDWMAAFTGTEGGAKTVATFGAIIAAGKLLAPVFGGIGTAISGVKDGFDKAKSAYDAVSSAWTNTKDFIAGLKGGADAAADLGTKAANAGAKAADMASALGSGIARVGNGIAQLTVMAAESVAQAARTSAAWVASAATAALEWAKTATKTALTWAGMAAKATINAVKTGAVWVAQTLVTTGTMLLQWGIAVAGVVAGWVVMAAQSLLQAARMAVAWLIAMGPIGLIIAGIIAFAALIWANWENIKKWTVAAFDAVVGAVKTAIDWVKNNWPLLLAILTGPIGLAVLWIVRHWDEIKAAFKSAFDALGGMAKTAMNAVIRALNGTIVAGINVVIRGMNKVNPFSDIPNVPNIPQLAKGAIVTRPTLAMIGEDGDEAVIPLSDKRKKRREELMNQAGLAGANTPADLAALGGWGPLDALAGGRSLASTVAASAATSDQAAPSSGGGTTIAEGAIQQTIINPVPETPSQTLNARMRRLASVGIFDSKPPGS